MGLLSKNEREKVFADYKEAQSYIDPILSGERANLFVMKPHQYLTPTICSERVPLDDKRGEFVHYTTIRNVLEKVLANQPTKSTVQFNKAPEFIRERLQTPETADSQ